MKMLDKGLSNSHRFPDVGITNRTFYSTFPPVEINGTAFEQNSPIRMGWDSQDKL